MAEVLGRIAAPAEDSPRGPDVVHGIRVQPEWLTAGRVVEFELPRNLTCASCRGGGCDRCNRAGAVTLRERGEPPELVQVTLPRCSIEGLDQQPPSVMIRIPEHGGLPEQGSGLPRGLLLLKVLSSQESDRSVRLAAPSEKPLPAPVPTPVPQRISSVRGSRVQIVLVAVLVLLLWLGFLIYLRSRGVG